jgi:H+/Cl- antiporter ClcA
MTQPLSVKSVTWREWLGLAAGLLALGSTFLPWTTLSTNKPDIEDILSQLPHSDVVRDAWHSSFFAWCPPLPLLLAGLVVVFFGRIRKLRVSGLPHLWLVVAAATLLLMVIGWFTLDWEFDADQRGIFEAAGIAINPGFGRFLGLFAALVSGVAAFLDMRAARAESRQPRKREPRSKSR